MLGNTKSIILKNGNSLSAHEQGISQIDGTRKMEEFYRVITKMRQNRKVGEVIDRNEFAQEWNRGLEGWNKNEERNLENPVGDYDSVYNHELEGE